MWIAQITNAGATLLARWSAGGTLHVDGASAGTGRVSDDQLPAATALSGTTHALTISGYGAVAGGVQFKIRMTSESSAYSATQIGIFAHLNSENSVLLAIYQAGNDEEIAIPSSAEIPDFAYIASCVIAMDNTGSLSVTVESTVYATMADLEDAVDTLMPIDIGALSELTDPIDDSDVFALRHGAGTYKIGFAGLAAAILSKNGVRRGSFTISTTPRSLVDMGMIDRVNSSSYIIAALPNVVFDDTAVIYAAMVSYIDSTLTLRLTKIGGGTGTATVVPIFNSDGTVENAYTGNPGYISTHFMSVRIQ